MKRILVQAGHKLPLQPGFEGQTGAQGEAQLVSDIQQALVRTLNADQNFHPIPMPGKLDDNLQVEGAIFLHADGFSNPSAHGSDGPVRRCREATGEDLGDDRLSAVFFDPVQIVGRN